MVMDILSRLEDKFLAGDGCWPWTGSRAGKYRSYGYVYDGKRSRPAHDVLYELMVGPIPEGLELDHLCRNTLCVRPDHLEPVTHQENMRRGKRGQATHCPQGHAYEGDNLITHQGRRDCRTCHNARMRSPGGKIRGPYRRKPKGD